jgi:chromosome segregation ATPase
VTEGEVARAAAEEKVAAAEARLAEALGESEALRTRLAENEDERPDHTGMLQRLGEETARLRGIVAEGETALAAANWKAAAAEARLTEALAELEAQRGRLAELEGEWNEQTASLRRLGEETARLRRVVADSEAALEAAKVESAALEARLAQALVEMEAHGSRIIEVEGERDEQIRTTEMVRLQVAALQATVTEHEQLTSGLEATLAEREATLAERETALQAATKKAADSEGYFGMALTEIGVLRSEVAKSREAVHEHAGARGTMEAEIASLHGDVAAARQVGRAMLAALRSDNLPPPRREGGAIGWRSILPRFFGLGRANPAVG